MTNSEGKQKPNKEPKEKSLEDLETSAGAAFSVSPETMKKLKASQKQQELLDTIEIIDGNP